MQRVGEEVMLAGEMTPNEAFVVCFASKLARTSLWANPCSFAGFSFSSVSIDPSQHYIPEQYLIGWLVYDMVLYFMTADHNSGTVWGHGNRVVG